MYSPPPEFAISKLAAQIFPQIEPTLFVVDEGHLMQNGESKFRMHFLHLEMKRQFMSYNCAVLSATTAATSLLNETRVDVLNIKNSTK